VIVSFGSNFDHWGARLFRWRSFVPLLLLGAVLVETALHPVPVGGSTWVGVWTTVGMALGTLGLGVRAWALGTAADGTSGRSTRAMRADTLNTTGAYSVARHPLYLGNLLLWSGVSAVAGRPLAFLLTCAFFGFVYGPIMAAEERFLLGRFGSRFAEWAGRTPRIVPTGRNWVPSARSFSVRAVLGRDYHALFAFVASTWLVAAVRAHALTDSWSVGRGWWIFLASGAVAFLTLHVAKHRTRMLRRAPPR
jgi:protein-S-isoprenylcysteine O-methyltransferase Ste14